MSAGRQVVAAALSLVPGDDGASPDILIPVRQPPAGNLMAIPAAAAPCSATCAAYRGEHGFALITGCWRSFQDITASPSKISDIARAALVLTHFEHG
jgi:hypothetical protein